MNENFVNTITALRDAEPNQIIEKLQRLFVEITQMNADQVVSAYQTVQTTADVMDLQNDKIVTAMLKAMCDHMQYLSAQSNIFDAPKFTSRFGAVTGQRFTDKLGY